MTLREILEQLETEGVNNPHTSDLAFGFDHGVDAVIARLREASDYPTWDEPQDSAGGCDITVQVEPPDQYTTSQAAVTVRLSTGSTVSAKALGPRPLWDTPARVNWSSIGPQSPDDALAYAAAIRKAAEVAVTLTGPTGVPS